MSDFLKNIEDSFKPISKRIDTIDIREFQHLFGTDKFPKGKIIEIFGKAGVGKSTLCLKMIKKLQEKYITLLVDSEFSFDKVYAHKLGVDLDSCIFSNDLRFFSNVFFTSKIDVIVIDSIIGLNLTKTQWAEFVTKIHKLGICVIIVNQIRTDIKRRKTVSAQYRTFTKDVDLQLKLINKLQIKKGYNIVGHTVYTQVTKNKLTGNLPASLFIIN